MKLAKLNDGPEIFYSIQGEGPGIGKPAIFIRLSLCNLHCTWCDTDYTWNWKGTPFRHANDKNRPNYEKYDKQEWIIDVSVEGILSCLMAYPCKRVVLTGGEPLVQRNELTQLAKTLKEKDYCLELETNGTLAPGEALDRVTDCYNVSPKLSNAGNTRKISIKKDVLSFFAKSNKSNFKFVVDHKNDLNEILSLLKDYAISPDNVYLMPQGTTPRELQEKQPWLVEVCKAYGFNFTDRLHITLYGDKRGV